MKTSNFSIRKFSAIFFTMLLIFTTIPQTALAYTLNFYGSESKTAEGDNATGEPDDTYARK